MQVEHCPLCNWRLFDMDWQGKTIIVIKCPRCKKVVTIVKEIS